MAEITAARVKELRETTGAGMMDCKKALQENDGEMEAAKDWLRKKGLSAAAKKAGRTAAEGLVAVLTEGGRGVAVEINSETDFVARNDTFQGFVAAVAKVALGVGGDLGTLKTAAYPNTGRTVEEEVNHNIATIGENMALRRAAGLTVKDGVIASYVHNKLADGLGKIGVLVALESTGDKAALEALGKQLAMHIASARPDWRTVADVDAATVERERAILSDKAKAAGKPDNIVEKMVEGGLRKFYAENVLLEQVFVLDNESKITKVIENASKEIGAPVALSGFVRFELGEGVAREAEEAA